MQHLDSIKHIDITRCYVTKTRPYAQNLKVIVLFLLAQTQLWKNINVLIHLINFAKIPC